MEKSLSRKKDIIILFDIDYTLFNTDIFKSSQLKSHKSYEEVNDVLKKLSQKAILGIFSEGKISLQRNKLLQTKILDYFQEENIHIFETKEPFLKTLLLKYKDNKVVIVDDKLTILHKAQKIMPSAVTVWVKRGKYALSQKPIEGFRPGVIIGTLNELIDFIALN